MAESVDVREAANRETPRRLFLEALAAAPFAEVEAVRRAVSSERLDVVFAYSTKTNPNPALLAIAKSHGWWAETISADEVTLVRRAGFAAPHSIFNGPQSPPHGEHFAYRFADSVEAYAGADTTADVLGVRLQPSMIRSRFGVPVEDDRRLAEAMRAAARGRTAVSMHVARQALHGATWRDACDDLIRRAASLGPAAGTSVAAFDCGGGWDVAAVPAAIQDDLLWLAGRLRDALPDVRRLIVEPGQAVTGIAEALVARVVEVRRRTGRTDAVIDLGYEDWPDMHGFVHPLFVARGGRWQPVERGGDRFLGATCLEYDLIEGLHFPDDLAAGDLILVACAGSYDTSMSFSFAHGTRHSTREAERVA